MDYARYEAEDARLVDLISPALNPDAAGKALLTRGMSGLKARAKTSVELTESAAYYYYLYPMKTRRETVPTNLNDYEYCCACCRQKLVVAIVVVQFFHWILPCRQFSVGSCSTTAWMFAWIQRSRPAE